MPSCAPGKGVCVGAKNFFGSALPQPACIAYECFFSLLVLCVCLWPCSLFVLRVPLNTNQPASGIIVQVVSASKVPYRRWEAEMNRGTACWMYDGIPAATTAIVSVSTAKWIYKPLSSLPAALSTLITCRNLVRHCVTLSLISCSQLFTCFPSCNALYKFKTYLLTYFRLSECWLGGGKTNFQLVRNFMPAVARGSFFGRPIWDST